MILLNRSLTFIPTTLLGLAAALSLSAMGCAEDPASLRMDLRFDHSASQVLVEVNHGLTDGQSLHFRVRQGSVGQLDCNSMVSELVELDSAPLPEHSSPTFRGPVVEDHMFETVYDASWLTEEGPSAELLERAMAGEWIVDGCLMDGDEVVLEEEWDVREALDQAGLDNKFDGDDDERIESTSAYAEACVAEMGEIPFFENIGEDDYSTFNCLDATPIPTTVTNSETGLVEYPTVQSDTCDNPQYIYASCEPNATNTSNGPRVTSAANDQGTHWVLLCRKAKADQGQYNDIAMIGHNPFTGKTCYFQNQLSSKTDGVHVPHPGDTVESETSPQQYNSLWTSIQGGLCDGTTEDCNSNIGCVDCHDADAFIHTPWIDGALRENGETVIPRMGTNDDFFLGVNDAPYSLINAGGQGWSMPESLVSPEAAACTRCHRIGNGRWMNRYLEYMDGSDDYWEGNLTEEAKTFAHRYWMPEDLTGLDEDNWAESDYGQSLAFIIECGNNPDDERCKYEALPTEPVFDDGGLPAVELDGAELAIEALKVLGADVEDPDDENCPDGDCSTFRCSECHAISKRSLRRWLTITDDGVSACNLNADAETLTPEQAIESVNCMRENPLDPTSAFAAEKIGIRATGVWFTQFRTIFQRAYGDDGWLLEYLRFRNAVSMPKGSHPNFSQYEYAVLLKWFDADLASLDTVLIDPPAPSTCEDSLDTTFFTRHLQTMEFEGWGAVNEDNGIHMHGCDSSDDPLNCFPSDRFSDRAEIGTARGVLRQVTALDFNTRFWTRSSADGRFVGNGGRSQAGRDSDPENSRISGTITDLAMGTDIGVVGTYDPSFFPDNGAFVFQGAGTIICNQRMLENPATRFVTHDTPGCVSPSGINLYQHVGRALGANGDYFLVNSQSANDPGGAQRPTANFNHSSTMRFHPMIFDGSTYQQRPTVTVDSPFEGDSVLSPSARLIVSRLAGADRDVLNLGYVVREVKTTPFGDSYRFDISNEVARSCGTGTKANFSYDERFFVTHDYEEDGTSNIILIDLLDNQRYTITDVPEGTQARFPHFVNNGWFYFLLDHPDGDTVIASDAAVRLAAGQTL